VHKVAKSDRKSMILWCVCVCVCVCVSSEFQWKIALKMLIPGSC